MLVYAYAHKNLTVVRSEQGIEGVRIYKMLIAKQKVNIIFSNDSGTI
jgi:acyl CoA:acetate/3-ketoacid CoA transferase alpha subunit